MNWDDLKIFLNVARQPKLERVAAQSNVDATTISRRLRRLENALELTLFERTRRGHILTPAGEALVRNVERMETLTLEMATHQNGEQSATGRIRLGVPEGIGTMIISPALTAFKHRHPLINVDLIALSGFVSVPKREADMSLLLTRPEGGRLKIRKLTNYTLGLYAAKSYVDRVPAIQSIRDLRHHTLIGYVDDLIYSHQLRYFNELLPDRTPDLCSTSILAQMQMISSGAGVGILPRFMAQNEPGLVNIFSSEFQIERAFWLATHEDVASLTRIRLMSEYLAETMKALS